MVKILIPYSKNAWCISFLPLNIQSQKAKQIVNMTIIGEIRPNLSAAVPIIKMPNAFDARLIRKYAPITLPRLSSSTES